MKKIIIVCFIIVLFIFIILRSQTFTSRYIGDTDDPRAIEEGVSTVYEWHWENLEKYLGRLIINLRRIIRGEPIFKRVQKIKK